LEFRPAETGDCPIATRDRIDTGISGSTAAIGPDTSRTVIGEDQVDIKEVAEKVGAKTGIDVQLAQSVLTQAFAIVGEQLAKEERVALQGFGTFLRKATKEPGKSRTFFRAWSAKVDHRKPSQGGGIKKAQRKERQGAKRNPVRN
jgi:nucleoid DNA-binding protein